jgi:site-specific DNA-methyltransferase (adenine-specific)
MTPPEPLVDLTSSCDYVIHADNLDALPLLPDRSFQLIYIDPPFNTGKTQTRKTLRTERSENGDRVGFGGRSYKTTEVARHSYIDIHDDYLAFLTPRLQHAHRLLTEDGSLYFHIDYRESHYCKLLLDGLFGRDCFLNEIIWAYDFGGRPRDRWPAKHDTILLYARQPGQHFFDQNAVDRIPYMAPGLVTPEKAARGKVPTDVWWQTIVPTNGREKTGYPTQKPAAILRRIVQASSQRGSWVLDFFAGSGTTAAVCQQLIRRFVMIDNSPEAITVMARRLGSESVRYVTATGAELEVPPPAESNRLHDSTLF